MHDGCSTEITQTSSRQNDLQCACIETVPHTSSTEVDSYALCFLSEKLKHLRYITEGTCTCNKCHVKTD